VGNLNPQIATIEIGVRSLREVTIFPLSLADQTKTARILAKAFQEIMDRLSSFGENEVSLETETIASMAKQLSNIDVMELIASAVQENLEIILGLVIDPHEKVLMEELTNDQFYKLVEIIYVVNYEVTSKNFVALLKRVRGVVPPEKKEKKKKVSRLKKSSQPSVGNTTTG
jgi:hypothetical protein